MIEVETLRTVTPRPSARPRLGFAGVGWIGRHRLEAIARAGCGEVAAIFDPVPEARTRTAELTPHAAIVGSFEDLLATDIDGVVIATPNALHAAQAIAALQRGKAVFCQKPLGRNAVEVRAIVDAARRADRLLGVDLSYRFTAGMQRIRERIQAGALGRIYAIEAVFHNAYGPDKPWFYHAELAGGGCLLDLGVHLVDLALWCLDFPPVRRVCGQVLARGQARSAAVEDYAAAQLTLGEATSLQLACSWKAPAGCDARIGITFFGDRGGAEFRNLNGSFYDFVAEEFGQDRSRRTLATPPDAWGGGAAVDWCERLSLSPRFDPAAAEHVAVAEVLDQIYGGAA